MWIKRDFSNILARHASQQESPLIRVSVLKGPRQVGKTSLLEQLPGYQLILFDDHSLRARAQESPSLFLDQMSNALILDEASLVPDLFPEIKKRVDQAKRKKRKGESYESIDYWITGSNQTLLSNYVQESLAGRASFFNLNTLSLHEIGSLDMSRFMLTGGWPEVHADLSQNPIRYLNNLISTFIEKDIVQAAGIEKKAAFTKSLQLVAGQVGELVNYSNIASAAGIESSTVQSWILVLEQNGLLRRVNPYTNNLNKRLIRTPKIYFEDIGLATRLQGWTEFSPLFVSPYFGHLVENIAYSEISRFFINNDLESKIYFVRNREKVEVDFLLELPNHRCVAIEVKATARDYAREQLELLDSLGLNIIAHWVVSPKEAPHFGSRKVIPFLQIYESLLGLETSP